MKTLDDLDRRLFSAMDRYVDASLPARLFDRCRTALVSAPDEAHSLDRGDTTLAALLGLIGLAVALWAMSRIPAGLYGMDGFNIWFQADQPRVVGALADRQAEWHYRASVHPLFSLLVFPPVKLLQLLGVPLLIACRSVIAATAFLSVCLLFLTLRHMGVSRATATLGSLAYVSSSTFLCWHALVETYAISGLTAILALYLVARVRRPSAGTLTLASAVSLVMVITNWTLGLLLVAAKAPLGKFVRYSAFALVLCAVLAIAQKRIFPGAETFFHPVTVLKKERRHSTLAEKDPKRAAIPVGTPLEKLRHLLVTPAVAPEPYVDAVSVKRSIIVNNQRSTITSRGWFGVVPVLAWLATLGLSLAALVRERRVTPLALALLAFIAGQVLLHLVYGHVTFLYAANFFVILVVLACVGGSGRWRLLHAGALTCFILSGAIANIGSFETATRLAAKILAARPGS